MTSILDDPFLAAAIDELAQTKIEEMYRLRIPSEEIGLVSSVDAAAMAVVVTIKGREDPQIAIGDRVPQVGDRVLVRKDPETGFRYVAVIFGRSLDESGSGGSGGSPNLDGGAPNSVYGGGTPIDGGTP